MKIYQTSIARLGMPEGLRERPPSTGEVARREQADEVSLRCLSKARRLGAELEADDDLDWERLAELSAQIADGSLRIDAEQVADAIVDQLTFVQAWLQ